VVNVSWLLNGTEVQTNESVTDASYTNINPTVGIWNVSAIATNENGTTMQTWIWTVSQQAPLTPSPPPMPSHSTSPPPTTEQAQSPSPTPDRDIKSSIPAPSLTPFMIYGRIFYENGSECKNPVVNIITSIVSIPKTPDKIHFRF